MTLEKRASVQTHHIPQKSPSGFAILGQMPSTVFSLRVLRCPSCSATLPVRGRDRVVVCDYCDARVEVLKTKAPRSVFKRKVESESTPKPKIAPKFGIDGYSPIPSYAAEAEFSLLLSAFIGFGIVAIVGLIALIVFLQSTRKEEVTIAVSNANEKKKNFPSNKDSEKSTSDASAPRVPAKLNHDPMPPVDEASIEIKTGLNVGSKNKSGKTNPTKIKPSKKKSSSTPAPKGPVLRAREARKALEPAILRCMQTHKVNNILAYMGNSRVGAVKVLGDSRSRVDGVRSKIKGTALGRCMNQAGATLRVRAFGGDYVRFQLVNNGVPDPLAHLPAKADRNEIDRVIASADAKILDCAKKHRVEGNRASFSLHIDGPSGNIELVRGGYISGTFQRCAERVYKKLRFPKVRERGIKVTKTLEM